VKEVFRASSPARVSLYKSVLESAGISCFVRNEVMQQAIPGGLAVAFLPLPDFWPTLCVVHDEDYVEAMELLQTADCAALSVSDAAEWICPACGETVPTTFASCWNCESEATPNSS
jgi:hypothetical protein